MAFQPFGYQFEIRSALSPDAVKAAIRSRKKGWFDPKDSARGWILGSVICLQWGASKSAPLLVGRISRNGLGTRISGRAGYLGSAAILLLTPLPIFLFYLMLVTGDFAFKSIAILVVLIGLISLVFWVDHKDAEPLVRFLRATVGKQGSSSQQPPLPVASPFPKPLTLNINGSVLDDPATPEAVREALLDIADDGFVILSLEEEKYMQTVGKGDGYIVEKRDGDDLHHYRAEHRSTVSADDMEYFTFEETLTLFWAYGSGAPIPSFVDWKKMRL